MTAIELRARAKQLRAEALQCIRDAETLEAAEENARRIAASAEAREALAATKCRPVWKDARADSPWVVEGIVDGHFILRRIGAHGDAAVKRYNVRSGYCLTADVLGFERGTPAGRIDGTATMLAWRAWCVSRRGDT